MAPEIQNGGGGENGCYGSFYQTETKDTNEKYPTTIIPVAKEHGKYYHPTQKPIALLEWLIQTYTNEGEVVLDFTMGSGSCGVACMKSKRKFIGIEADKAFYDIACKRIKDAQSAPTLF